MIVAGLGFRAGAPVSSLHEALDIACQNVRGVSVLTPNALASTPEKVAARQMQSLAATLGLPLQAVAVAGIATQTDSPRIRATHATGSLAEAAALAAAGPGARLLVARVISTDGMATAAIAEGQTP